MKKFRLSLFLITLFPLGTSLLAQTSYLNKYFYEIKDTTKVKPWYFAIEIKEGSRITKDYFRMDSTLAMQKLDFLDEKRASSKTKWTYFDASGSVIRETNKSNQTGDSTVHTYFYPDGVVKDTKLLVNNRIIYHKYFDEAGQERSVTVIEAQPQGGLKAWNEFLRRNLRYPELLLDEALEGTVRVALELDSAGNVSLFEVMNPETVHAEFQKEALRVVGSFVNKPWQPRTENGIPTEASFVLPIVFRIEEY